MFFKRLCTTKWVWFYSLVAEMIMVSSLVSIVSCKVPRNVSDDKFKPMVPGFYDVGDDHFDNVSFLIKKVHADELTIAYGFINDDRDSSLRSSNHCPASKQTAELKAKLEQTMTEIINMWLEPLRHQDYGGDKIVKKFIFTYLPAVWNSQTTRIFDNWVINSKRGESFDLEVIFSCGDHSVNRLLMPNGHKEFRAITPSFIIGAKSYQDDDRYAPYVHEQSYSKPQMTANFGIAFGLQDSPPDVLSATSSNPLLRLRDKDNRVVLSDDDNRGIRWLYKYYHGVVDSCLFDDYRLVISSKSRYASGHTMKCVPKNPMIVMVKQAHRQESYANFMVAKQIVNEIKYEATDSPQTKNWLTNSDNLGNTLLHYVAHYWQWSEQQNQTRDNELLSETAKLALSLPSQWQALAQELIKYCQIQQLGKCELLKKNNKENRTPCHYQLIADLVPKHCL